MAYIIAERYVQLPQGPYRQAYAGVGVAGHSLQPVSPFELLPFGGIVGIVTMFVPHAVLAAAWPRVLFDHSSLIQRSVAVLRSQCPSGPLSRNKVRLSQIRVTTGLPNEYMDTPWTRLRQEWEHDL